MTNTASRREARAAATLADPRWATVRARDAGADGQFVYAVSSTGVYCRPSCGARTPRPENVSFHASRTDAEAAGFRPCKRCRPDLPPLAERQAAMVAALCRQIDDADTLPSLDALAASAGCSRFHLLRVFRAHTGLTPRAWAAARRAERLRERLADGASVTEAIVDAGYGSTSRVYEKSARPLGMTPRRYRAGGADTDIRFAIAQCALGALLVAASTQGVCEIALGDDADALARELQDRFPQARLSGDDADFARVVAQVVGFVEAPRIGLALPLDLRGTAFQQRVWAALRAIPPGQTLSYTELAQRIGAPAAVRAVASACAANTLAVAVPCHRVVRTDGSLSGYRWGVVRKRALLDRERSD
ncbi:bifunctional DNA-binding transcriptional regulator/O6-methylguanine-DNA methyltransferase Ada [Methyloversatilis discipulorum]|uniref:bifunctional DNA-binding transcriptional regulator/O6-methylguanine-DNA methyltransferase Ada n=1 Tax=Methyloversatilis discipulorum TaxID=1119528 RepID=UPI003138213A